MSALSTSFSGLRSEFATEGTALRGEEVLAPSLRHAPESLWQRVRFWLTSPAPLDTAPPLSRLPTVRDDFVAVLADIKTLDAKLASDRVRFARSLRELWHLRAEVYRVVALHCSQAEAEQRLRRLNRHFSTRASRSTFAPL